MLYNLSDKIILRVRDSMIDSVFVHPHALKHGVAEDDVRHAWSNFVRSQQRSAPKEEQIVRIGYGLTTETAIQMIGVVGESGVLIIHAMTPPQESIIRELGL